MPLRASYYAGESYYPADMMQRENDWVSPGVLSTSDLVATQTGTPSMAVAVTGAAQGSVGGNAWLPGGYRVYNDSAATVAVTAANATYPRIDLLVACVDTTTSPYAPSLRIIQGTAAASPVVPAVPAGLVALALYRIAVAANATTIVNANLTDVRVVAGLVGVPSQDEFTAHQAETATMHGAVSAATANKLIIRDANGRAKVAAPSAADDIARLDTITAAIATLVNSSPAALDTLKELSDALGADANFATTMTNALAAKVALSLLTTQADTVYATGAGAWARLAKGTELQQYRMNAGATAPEWFTPTPGAQVASGSYTGDGTTSRTITVGFRPKFLYVMKSTAALLAVDDGSASFWLFLPTTYMSNDHFSGMASTGFITGSANSHMNTNAIAFKWIAVG